jgi:asparagine synthase (glutamine-hydrolysing)
LERSGRLGGMKSTQVARASGIIGCLDPAGSLLPPLSRWCADLGATKLVGEDGFTLWTFSPGKARTHPISQNGLTGALTGVLFRLPSDTLSAERSPSPAAGFAQTVAALYRGQGPSGLARVDGQFNLMLWDKQRRELLLYRDGTAARSLFFSRVGSQGLVFADGLDLLVQSPLVEKRLSSRAIHEFLRFLDISPPNCIYEGVTATEPGVLYRMGTDLVREELTADLGEAAPSRNLQEAADELEALLCASISKRMDPERTTISFLSGGVDSSLVCALAARHAPGRVQAMTIGFEEGEFDESRIAVGVAEQIGVPHQVLAFGMAEYRKGFEKLTSRIEYPSADPAGVPTLLAFETARNLSSCALDGTGADTLFGVMPARHQRLAVELGSLVPLPLRRLATRVLKITPGLAEYTPLLDFDDPEEVLIRWRGWSRRELERLCAEPVSLDHTRFYQLFRTFPRKAHLERYSAVLGNLPDDRIHQAAQLTGMDVRFPYVDPAVTDWVSRSVISLRYRPDEPKRVLKTVLERYVPRPLWDFPKHGFDFPFLQLMTAADCDLIRTYLDPSLTSDWGLFNQDEIQAAQRALIGSDGHSAFSTASPAFRTWALVVLFAWLENHYRNL